MSSRIRAAIALAAAGAAVAIGPPGGLPGHASADAGSPITYRTLFQDPGVPPVLDYSLEDHARALIAATPAGERITFAFRDFNRLPVTNALLAAAARGVQVDGVIDGGERNRVAVKALVAGLGAEHAVVCGSPGTFNSCIANSLQPSLQHNKFLTFSRLEDGRQHVILETSENFFEPSQYGYYNDMVEIAGDHALYDGYITYLEALKAQVRSDDHYVVTSGDDGRNTMYPSPRRQANLDVDDTIVDRMDEIDCSQGGSPSGRGLIRIANMAFRSERSVIMRKLVELHGDGCDIDVVVSNVDGDILAPLVSAGIPVHPFAQRAIPPAGEVVVHDKFWLVDAMSTVTGARTKVTYAGSSNWRADEQKSDDLLLRIIDDGVYDAYLGYWTLIRSRAVSDQAPPTGTDAKPPASALTPAPAPNAAGWNSTDVTLRIAASDGHRVGQSGLQRLHVEMSGAQSGSWDFPGEASGYNVQELAVSAEGLTTVTYFAEDRQGNVEVAKTLDVRIDRTAPVLTGLPRTCELWPPDNKLVRVADVAATDPLSGVASFSLSAFSDAVSDFGDVVIATDADAHAGSVDLRAEKAAFGATRTYTLAATATDVAGNAATGAATCVVPHSQGAATK